MPRQAHSRSRSITDMTRIHQDLCSHVSRISHATAAPDCWRKRSPQKWGKLILPFGRERLPQWIAIFQNIHVQTFHLLLPAQTWMTLKFYLVLFRLPWPEWVGEMSPTNLVICRKHTVLSNTTHLICRHPLYPTLESQPWSWGHPEYHDSHSLVPSLLRLWRQWELLLHMSF